MIFLQGNEERPSCKNEMGIIKTLMNDIENAEEERNESNVLTSLCIILFFSPLRICRRGRRRERNGGVKGIKEHKNGW